jgi:iron(II)-dependent oxidoreductase
MQECRSSTLALVDSLSECEYYRQAHADFSPIGWHLGHIAFTEALWVLEHLAGEPNPLAADRQLYAADGLPKAERESLPDLSTTLDYLATVREKVEKYLTSAPLGQQARLLWWLLQHESQHAETISIVLAMHRRQQGKYLLSDLPLRTSDREICPSPQPASQQHNAMVWLPAAEVTIGHDGIESIDNEQPPFSTVVEGFWIDAHLVTRESFREFIAAGGYTTEPLWSVEGWDWQQKNGVTRPFYWSEDTPLDEHPVCGVSYFEAEAYARFVGKRLPTELEWERAACWSNAGDRLGLTPWGDGWLAMEHGNFGGKEGMTTPVGECPQETTPNGVYDLLGNVWEWTTSWFVPYDRFQAFPYRGYSAAYFDNQHRVLRGGSWATRPWALRGTLRNWYHPHVRQIFAGFRCVRDG